MLDPVFTSLAALCGALLFGSAVLHKWRRFGEFAASVEEYRLLPQAAVPAAALVLAALEAVVCTVLLFGLLRGASGLMAIGALMGGALLALYALAMAINLARGRRDLDCGCGIVRKSISASMVVRNLLLAAFIACAAMPASSRTLGIADYATIVGALAVCGLLYASAELLLGRAGLRRSLATEIS